MACVRHDGICVHSQWCCEWIRSFNRGNFWVVNVGINSVAVPSRGSMPDCDFGMRLGIFKISEYPYHATDSKLSTSHGWMCHDLEGKLDVPCWNASCGVQHHWDVWCCGELDYCDRHEVGDKSWVSVQVLMCVCSNVAGATKKSCMAAAIFVAYCVGNIVGPQLIKSKRKKDHYPELWMGLIIW